MVTYQPRFCTRPYRFSTAASRLTKYRSGFVASAHLAGQPKIHRTGVYPSQQDVFLGSTPRLRIPVTTRIVTFLGSGIPINCSLPLFLGGRSNANAFLFFVWCVRHFGTDVARDKRRQAWPFGTEFCEVRVPELYPFEGEVPPLVPWSLERFLCHATNKPNKKVIRLSKSIDPKELYIFLL